MYIRHCIFYNQIELSHRSFLIFKENVFSYNQQCSELTLGLVLENQSGWYVEDHTQCQNQTMLGCMQRKHLSCYTLSPVPVTMPALLVINYYNNYYYFILLIHTCSVLKLDNLPRLMKQISGAPHSLTQVSSTPDLFFQPLLGTFGGRALVHPVQALLAQASTV